MIFYFWSLLLSIVVSSIVLILLFRSLKVNHERKNRLAIGYLSPVGLTLVFLILTIQLAIPRLLDVVPLLTKTYSIEEVQVDASGLGWNSVEIGDRRFFFNQWQIDLEAGQRYRIEFTPRSHYLVSATRVETGIASPRAVGLSDTAENP